jgi:hypothetical protein
VVTQATHGFVAVGDPLVVTVRKAEPHHRAEWSAGLVGLYRAPAIARDRHLRRHHPGGRLAERLPAGLAAEYGNDHILRVVTKRDADGTMHYATTASQRAPSSG